MNIRKYKYIISAVALSMMMTIASENVQAASIYGFVKDSLNQAVEVATISLFRSADSVFVKAELTDVDGKFEFVEIPAGMYYLIVSVIGYETYRSEDFNYAGGTSQFNLGDIRLSSAGLQLDEVRIN